jgi:hypothetical protein
VRLVAKQKYEELKDNMRLQAYLGWLIYLMQPSQKRQKRKTLKEWFDDLGLGDVEDMKKEPQEKIEEMKKKSLAIAEKIVAMDKEK